LDADGRTRLGALVHLHPAVLTAKDLSGLAKSRARELGFAASGISPASVPPSRAVALREWLARGFHGGMRWMEDADRRIDPSRLLRGAKSVVMVALAYPADPKRSVPGFAGPNPGAEAGGPAVPESGKPDSGAGAEGRSVPGFAGPNPGAGAGGPAVPESGSSGKVAAFARGRDYHAVIGERLRLLLADLVAAAGCRGKVCVDSSPLMEKAMAEQAGLGWIGRNSVLVCRAHGPWLLLGGVILDVELEPDEPAAFGCGDCRRCMAACPTGALVTEGMVDARRCLACLTIEARGPFPPDLEGYVGDRLFGCDECLAACPFGPGEPSPAWEPREVPAAAGFLALDDGEFARKFGDTPMARAGRKGMARNAELVVRNRGTGGKRS